MANDFQAIIQIAYDMAKGNKQLQSDIKKIQEQYKIKFKAELDEKSALNSIKQMEKYQDSFNKKNLNGIDLEIKKRKEQSQIFSNQIKSQMQERISAENKIQSELKQTAKDQQNALNLNNGKQQLYNNITTYINNNKKLTSDLKGQLLGIQSQIKSIDSIDGLKNLKQSFRSVTSEAAALGKTGGTALSQLVKHAGQLVGFLGATTLVMGGIRALRNVVTEVKNLDESLVDLQQATGYSREEAGRLLNTYFELGQEMGATATDVADGAANWLRQGKSIAETNTLIRDSMILSKIGQIDSADATTYLTTAMKGYGVATSDVLGIVDKLSAVDMASATSVDGLAIGMSEVATNANMAGISMDKLLGYLALIGETTGSNMSSVGNSLSTMFSRMGNIKLSRLDDYQNNGEDLSNVETVLRGLGIELRDTNQSFRNFGEVLDETADRWSGFDEVSKRAVASSIAGKDHMEDFLVLMSGYDKAMEYSTISTESAGEAMKKFGMYSESVEAKTKKLSNSFQSLSFNTIDSEWVKGFLDLSNVLVNLTDDIGLFNIAILITSGILASKTTLGMNGFAFALDTLITKMGIATGTATTLSSVLSVMIPIAVIIAATKAYDALTTSISEHASKIDEIKASYESLSSEYDQLSAKQDLTEYETKRLDYLEKRLELDQKILDIETKQMNQKLIGTKWTDNFDSDSLLSKQTSEENKQDKDSFVNLNRSTSNVLDNISKVQAKIDEAKSAQDEMTEGSARYEHQQTYINKLLAEQSGYYADLDSLQGDLLTKQGQFLDYAQQSDEIIASGTLTGDDLAKAEEMSAYWNGLYEAVSTLLSDTGSLDGLTNGIDSASDSVDDLVTKSQNAADTVTSVFNFADGEKSIDNFQSSINALSDAMDKIKDGSFSNSDMVDLLQDFPQLQGKTDDLSTSIEDLVKDSLATLLSTLGEGVPQELVDSLTSMANEVVSVKDNIGGLSEAISAFQDTSDALDKVKSDLEEVGAISSDTINKLLSMENADIESAMARYLSSGDANEILNVLSDIYQTDLDNYHQIILAKLQTDTEFWNNVMSQSSDAINSLLSYYGVDVGNWSSMEQAKIGITTQLISQLSSAWSKYFKVTANGIVALEGQKRDPMFNIGNTEYMNAYRAANQASSQMYDIAQQLDSIAGISLEGTTANLKKATAATKDLGKGASKAADETDRLKESLDNLNNELDRYKSAHSAVISVLDKEIDSLQELVDLEKERLNLAKDQADATLSAVDKLYSDEIDRLEEQKSAIEDTYKSKMDLIQDEIDALEDRNNESSKELALEKAKLALYNAQNQKTNLIYDKDKGYIFTADQSAIREAKENLAEAELEIRLKRLNDLKDQLNESLKKETEVLDASIKKLNEYKDLWAKVSSAYSDEQNKMIAAQKLGANWESDLLNGRLGNLNKFLDEYKNIERQLNDIEDEKTANQQRIAELEKYKKSWQSVLTEYQDTQNRLMAAQIMGADWESQILNGRIDTLTNFKNRYLALQAEIAAAQEAINNASASAVGSVASSGGGSSGGGSSSSTSSVVGTRSRYIYGVYNGDQLLQEYSSNDQTTSAKLALDHKNNFWTNKGYKSLRVGKMRIEKYAKGVKKIKQDELAWTQDALGSNYDEMILSPSNNAILTPLKRGDSVLNANATDNIWDFANSPKSFILDSINGFSNQIPVLSSNNNNAKSIIFSGDIVLNGVNNPEEFGKALKMNIGNIIKQNF